MKQFGHKYIVLFSLWIMVVGCTHNPNLDDKEPILREQENRWANETNIDTDDIDISDIDENLSLYETHIIEENNSTKVKRVPFLSQEYAGLKRKGYGTIKGKIYLQDAYNVQILGAQTRLYLNPVTSYSNQWFKESYMGGRKMEKADDKLYNYLRFTTSNAQGEFAFYGLPKGKYYLIGTVKCAQACGYSTQRNIRIATMVEVVGKEAVIQDLIKILN